MDYHKTIILDCETSGLPIKMVLGKSGKMIKKQLDYATEYMQFPFIISMAWKVDDEETKHFIINQEGREIPKEASDIHGITTEIANASETSLDRCFLEFCKDADECEIVVGHGIYFDTSILKANLLRLLKIQKESGDLLFTKWWDMRRTRYEMIEEILHKDKRIDTMRSSVKIMRKWPKLSELHQKLFRKGFDAHNAKEDVEACYRCYQWLLKNEIVPTWEKLQEKRKEKENGFK